MCAIDRESCLAVHDRRWQTARPMSNAEPSREFDGQAAPGTNLVIWVLWLTYGSFYFCRTNIAAALPGIELELGFTKT